MVRGLVALIAVLAAGRAAAEPPALEPASGRTNFFAGREATFGTLIRGGDAAAGRLAWTLTALGRTLAGGTLDVRHDGGPATVAAASAAIPEVKQGVVVEAVFSAVLVDAAGTRLAAHARPVRIFSADPFGGRSRWLEAVGLALFDPAGDTERVLTAAGVPFTLVRSEADVAAAKPRLLVVGEGTSWSERPELPPLVAGAVARGVPVLCLAGRGGTLPLPATAGEAEAERLVLQRAGVVAAIDPRLDGHDWGADGGTVVGRVAVVADGDRAVIRFSAAEDEPAGWPWLEIDSAAPAPPARLIACGYGIVAHWDETPAARYLFAALLVRLTADPLPTNPIPTNPIPTNPIPTNPIPETHR